VAIQDDFPEGWSLRGTLIYFGLGVLAPSRKEKPNPPSPEEAKEMFAAL
jgi:hypothetical protein